jgi:protein-tyrosine phosphatase
MVNVLFVCMGNICRSPMAEAVFRHLVEQAGLADQFHIDSVGTHSYHVGEPAHRGTRQVLAEHQIACEVISRQVSPTDLQNADYILVADRGNMSDLKARARGVSLQGRLHLLLDFAPNQPLREVPDPYYSGNFEQTYQLVNEACRGLLAHIQKEHGI